VVLYILLASGGIFAQTKPQTFCNPLNLNYSFTSVGGTNHRTAADPLITLYKNDYYLFASASGGYWFSDDMRDWTFVEPKGLPLEKPAPAILILGDKIYYTAHRLKEVYETDDPKTGVWRKVADIDEYADPAFLLDDDGRLYLYFGASLDGGISVVELDPKQNFKVVAKPVKLMNANSAEHGWEGAGEDNLGYVRNGVNRVEPYIEGSWMTKHNGTYYLQYSAPGTIWKTYADGVYTSKSPDKDFVYQQYSPFSYKPGGFIGSAGHAGTFKDKAGNYWRVATMVISVAHKFERRLGIFPAGFDADGVMRTNTYLGDYPQFLPGMVRNPLDKNRTDWMLLSFGKKATASSTLENRPVENAFDEDVRTVWSGESSAKDEWLSVDLETVSNINAVQINFAEQDSTAKGRAPGIYQQYVLEISDDGKNWKTLVDKSRNQKDAPHDYIEFSKAAKGRFIKLTNFRAASGKFAVRDLRVFGNASRAKPAEVKNFTVRRNPNDGRKAVLNWQSSPNADGYTIRFGISPKKLYGSYQVNKGNSLMMNGLNKNVKYYFSIEAFNAGGAAESRRIISAEK
ncbi:MAG: discoidin domain-containing protein, partial [Acidobacteriota bacterium]|nr:discoidin domain-containing protein [Acidobacteriota bacterium]